MPGLSDKPFDLDADLPLKCRIFVGPLKDGGVQLNYLEEYKKSLQSSLVFPATNLVDHLNREPIQDLFYQIHFFNAQLGDNPDWTYSSFLRVK